MKNQKITEMQNHRSINIDRSSTSEILKIINSEDKIVANAVNKELKNICNFIDASINRLKKAGKMFYVGCGTSGRLGILDAVECPPTFGVEDDIFQGIIAGGKKAIFKSVEYAEDDRVKGEQIINEFNVNSNDIVLGITASSSAQFVLGALEASKKIGALTGFLICNNSTKYQFIDHYISIIVGPEVIAGSTRMKSGTATKLVLNMISTTCMIKLNKVYKNYMVDLKVVNNKLKKRAISIINQLTNLDIRNIEALLNSANGEVKTAIVMHKLNLSYLEAKKIIDNNNGSLSKVIDN